LKASEIQIGGKYIAKVSGKLTTVRVDSIRDVNRYIRNNYSGQSDLRTATTYDVTNLTTGRKTTFRSAAKFRRSAEPKPAPPIPELTPAEIDFLWRLDHTHWIEVEKAPATDRLQAAGLIRYHAPMHSYVITPAGQLFLKSTPQ